MKKNLNIKKIILITIAVIPGICLSFYLAMIMLFYIGLYFASQYTMNVFEINNDKYNVKVIEEMDLRGAGVGTDLFSYKSKNEKKKIGCGKLILIGYDAKKEYLYGKSEYGNKERSIAIYLDNEKSIIGNDLYTNDMTEKESVSDFNFLKKLCTGYFVLNLKTGEYKGGLSEEQQKKILSEKEIKTPMLSVQKFLKINGKEIKNYEEYEAWMIER